ncbi:MAG TPA: hypothetical protein VHS99_24940 [Chloroflexota bacterium]|jgi:hypothetical protein|nr:hypothetical protein [Chloroflexota bacterium]
MTKMRLLAEELQAQTVVELPARELMGLPLLGGLLDGVLGGLGNQDGGYVGGHQDTGPGNDLGVNVPILAKLVFAVLQDINIKDIEVDVNVLGVQAFS